MAHIHVEKNRVDSNETKKRKKKKTIRNIINNSSENLDTHPSREPQVQSLLLGCDTFDRELELGFQHPLGFLASCKCPS